MLSIATSLYAGFTHAYEADHLLAVSNLVSQKKSFNQSVKQGIYWGLGHTTTIFLIGILILLLKVNIPKQYFTYFEALVGIVLIGLGFNRLIKLFMLFQQNEKKRHTEHYFKMAFSVGLLHGLAGSGALIIMVVSQTPSVALGLTYLLLFGLGSILGMLLAAGLFSLSFSQKMIQSSTFQKVLIFVTAVLCIAYGTYTIYEQIVF